VRRVREMGREEGQRRRGEGIEGGSREAEIM